MVSSSAKPSSSIPPAAAAVPASEAFRTRSIATRLTEVEYAEVESAAASAGKKVAEWLRDAALAQAHTTGSERTDPILLAEIMGMRALLINLFAKASEEPLSTEDLRKISAYADAVKNQKAEELLAQVRRRNGASTSEGSG